MGWPQQPLTERTSDISKISDFLLFLTQKGTHFRQFSAKDDAIIRMRKTFEEIGL